MKFNYLQYRNFNKIYDMLKINNKKVNNKLNNVVKKIMKLYFQRVILKSLDNKIHIIKNNMIINKIN